MKLARLLMASVAASSFAAAALADDLCSYDPPLPLAAGAQADPAAIRNDAEGITIAYLPMGTEFNYHVALGEGIKQVADSRDDVEMFLLSPYSGSDLAGQMGMLQDVTARADVDAIVLLTRWPEFKRLPELLSKRPGDAPLFIDGRRMLDQLRRDGVLLGTHPDPETT